MICVRPTLMRPSANSRSTAVAVHTEFLCSSQNTSSRSSVMPNKPSILIYISTHYLITTCDILSNCIYSLLLNIYIQTCFGHWQRNLVHTQKSLTVLVTENTDYFHIIYRLPLIIFQSTVICLKENYPKLIKFKKSIGLYSFIYIFTHYLITTCDILSNCIYSLILNICIQTCFGHWQSFFTIIDVSPFER